MAMGSAPAALSRLHWSPKGQRARRRFLENGPEEVAVTVLSVEEQLSGWYTQLRKAKSAERLAWAYDRLTNNVRFLSRLQILTFNKAAIDRFEDLRKRKLKIGRI